MDIKPFDWPDSIEFTRRERTNFFIVHHSASPDVPAGTIHEWHLERGWLGIGYNYLIRENGNIEAGRPHWAQGAHCRGKNDVSVGICLTGNFEEHEPTPEQLESLARLVRHLWDTYPDAEVKKHSDFGQTKCPGEMFPWGKFMDILEGGNMSKWKDLDQCWYPELAKKAVEEGIISGFEDGTLRPREPVTREQMWLVDLRQQKVISQIPYIPDMVKKYMPSIVRIWNDGSVGSGSFVAPNLILTNQHVVGDADTVSVDTHDHHPRNDKKQGKVIKRDKEKDLALVKLPGKEHTPLELATEEDVKHGEFCLVLGNPGGEFEAVSAGIVTHDDRGQFIGTDARVNPGNSGGAVIDARGKMIGVPRHKIALKGFDNQNYCIRVSVVREFLKGVL